MPCPRRGTGVGSARRRPSRPSRASRASRRSGRQPPRPAAPALLLPGRCSVLAARWALGGRAGACWLTNSMCGGSGCQSVASALCLWGALGAWRSLHRSRPLRLAPWPCRRRLAPPRALPPRLPRESRRPRASAVGARAVGLGGAALGAAPAETGVRRRVDAPYPIKPVLYAIGIAHHNWHK